MRHVISLVLAFVGFGLVSFVADVGRAQAPSEECSVSLLGVCDKKTPERDVAPRPPSPQPPSPQKEKDKDEDLGAVTRPSADVKPFLSPVTIHEWAGSSPLGDPVVGKSVEPNLYWDMPFALKSYKAAHDGKAPPKLSDLYYESYADDVATYRCPTAGGGRLKRTEIDDKSDFTLDPLPGQKDIIVRERAPHHGDKTVLAVLEDGSMKALPLGEVPAEGAGKQPSPTDGHPETGRTEAVRGGTSREGARGDQALVVTPAGPNTGGIQVVPLEDEDFPKDLPKGAVISRGATKPGEAEGGSREDTARDRRSANTIRGAIPPEISLNIADSVYKDGGYDAALDFYEKVLEAEPGSEQALLGHARASLRTGALRLARQELQKVLDQSPGHVEARRLSATIDLVHGEVKRAAAEADTLAKDQPKDPEVALLHGQAALYAGDEAEARRRFEAVAKTAPNAAAEHRKLADEYMNERLLKLALLHYATAAALDPADDEALLGLGRAAAAIGEKQRAIRALTEYLRHHPSGADAAVIKQELQELIAR